MNASTAKRQSGIELLRIIAMLFVLVLHADYLALGYPKQAIIKADPLSVVSSVLLESMAVVSVNVFVMISGWFGLRPSWKGAFKLLYQSLFLSLLVLLGAFVYTQITGEQILTASNVIDSLKDYWFLWTYLILYAISPLLNSFVEHSGKRKLLHFLIIFYALQFICEFFVGSRYFSNGYSVLSFMGLYLLARYLKLYASESIGQANKNLFLLIYLFYVLISTFFIIASAFLLPEKSIFSFCIEKSVAYSNPFIVCGAVFLLLSFVGRRLENRVINLVAESCFAVYLLNTNAILFPFYYGTVRSWYKAYSGVEFLLLTWSLVVLFFLGAVLADRLRIFTWRKLSSWIYRDRRGLGTGGDRSVEEQQ